MKLLEKLQNIWSGIDYPFLICNDQHLRFSDIEFAKTIDLSLIKKGEVVAIIGDFNAESILTILYLIELSVVIVPLTTQTVNEHEYFFDSACVDVVIDNGYIKRRNHGKSHELIEKLKDSEHAGLIVFSSGSTGRPKAILHDLDLYIETFSTQRKSFRIISFLVFDHIGGINTLLHALFNKGTIVAPEDRSIDSILEVCEKYQVEVLPATPTFLRVMLISGAIPNKIPNTLKIISYGTERMDQITLNILCELLPNIEFRQMYGTTELGVIRVKSFTKDSLYMKIGGEGIETRIVDNILQIRSKFRMLGYLNAPSPFDADGWYDTKDVIEEWNGYCKIVGRTSDVINVGGLKFMASEVERVALEFPNVSLVKAYPRQNPITGQHVELIVQSDTEKLVDKNALVAHLKSKLQPHMVPKRIRIEDVTVGHRFKKM
jgi:acyl-coenzyme A synthetase/AMP-(fatty) acid ligase